MVAEGPLTDEFVYHMILTARTQAGIIKYAEAMAQVLAEAGLASQKATGDSPSVAIRKWSDVIRSRALEIVAEKSRRSPMQEKLLKMQRELQTEKQLLKQHEIQNDDFGRKIEGEDQGRS